MGNYNIKSQILRCENCYSIKKVTIDPAMPQSFVKTECRCESSKLFLQNFLKELNKGASYKIICKICKKEDKNASYCNDCNHIYCSKCIKDHNKHRHISISKVDFYCVFHQKELFFAFCKDCSMNFCKKCEQEKKHLNHSICTFNKLIMSKSDRNYLKEKFRLAENKLEYSTQFATAFAKKLKNEEQKNIITNAEKKNLEQNKDILELVNFFIYFYDNSKYKNYSIIYNFTENINLNVNKFKFSENNVGLEDAYKQILQYFNEDFIIIRNDKMGEYKDNKKEDNSGRNKSLWEFEDENEIGTRQTVIGTMAFNQFGLNLNDNYNSYNDALNKKENLLNSLKNTNKKVSIFKNKYPKPNVGNDDDNYYRPRSHAIFIPTKNMSKQVKNKNQNNNKNDKNDEKIENIVIKEENEEIENNDNKQDEIIKDDKEKEIKNEEKIKENENKKVENKQKEKKEFKKEIKKEIKEEKEETKEEIKEEIKKEIKKEIETRPKKEIKEGKEIKEETKFEIIKENPKKYEKFIGINHFRYKNNSLINKMMINGLKKQKIY